jgi:two-component system sensor histidine kinase KdpD
VEEKGRDDGARGQKGHERVIAAVTGAPSGDALIRRAAHIAERTGADLVGVHVGHPNGSGREAERLLDRHHMLLRDLGGSYHELVSSDVAGTLLRFAREEGATQVVLGATKRSRWTLLRSGSVINSVIRRAGTFDVHVIVTGDDEPRPRRVLLERDRSVLSVRRRVAGWLVAVAGSAALTAALAASRAHIEQPSRFLLYLTVVLLAASVGGAGPAVGAALLATASLNWYFTPPFHTWTIEDAQNVLALVVFTAVGLLVAVLVTGLARRSADAQRARAEAEALARIAGSLAGADDPLPVMVERIRATLGVDGVALYAGDDAVPLVRAGLVATPGSGTTISLVDATFVVAGSLTREGRRVLEAFAAQLTTALEQRRLQREAAEAAVVAEADALRSALLRAVSHDLRTPLSSIKASVTSLLQGDVSWSPDEHKEFLLTIDEEADRLDHVVADLLDASRLEAGAVSPDLRPVALDDVAAASLATVSGLSGAIEVEIPAVLPMVLADPGLLERAIANLVANAAKVTPPGEVIRIVGTTAGEQVELRIIDRGPGVPESAREQMFQPFQRLGDSGAGGVGLGLTVAKGLVKAMDGAVVPEDTPGGGLTMVISMPRAAP